MDLKNKLKSLLTKQNPAFVLERTMPDKDSHISLIEENISHELFADEPAVSKYKHEMLQSNPQEDRETIENIDKEYYEDTDTSLFELQKLPEALNLEQIDDDRNRLQRQLQAVSKKVSELVLENHPAYAAELQRVMELQKTLQLATIICKDGRGQLSEARHKFTLASLRLLSNVRKRQQLRELLKFIKTIKTLQRTDLRLREMMVEEDFCGAIQLCLECQKAAAMLKHYACISELSSKLQDTLESIEEQLDYALSKTCVRFDAKHYQKIQQAYDLLGKRQMALDQLHLHFTSAIHNTAFQVVLGYVELYAPPGGATNFNKLQFADLCKHVTIESFTPCLIGVCKALWGIMKSYHCTTRWHETHLDTANTDQASDNPDSMSVAYIKQKLEHGLVRIWQDVQQKVRTYILGINLSAFKLEEFIHFLDIVNRMIDIGEYFCDSKSEGLQDSLKQQSLNYFKNHHRAKMDELRMFLENEGWELCPVKSSFHVLHLVEFKFMRQSVTPQNFLTNRNARQPTSDQSEAQSLKRQYFEEFSGDTTPFDFQTEQEEKEDVFAGAGDDGSGGEYSDSDSDVPEELKQDFIDELTGETHSRPGKRKFSRSRSFQKHVSIVTNTSLNIFRVLGRYIQMMRLLKPIAFDVVTCVAQLFDFYLYAVYLFFGQELGTMDNRNINIRLKTTLHRIEENLIFDADTTTPASNVDQVEHRERMHAPHLSPIVDLKNPARMYGLAERIVAAESLVFLGEQMEFLLPHLEAIIPGNKKAFLQQFYSQTVNMASELRKPVYWAVSSRVINYEIVLQHMASVRWDVKEIMSQHNSYIDVLIQAFKTFNTQLGDICKMLPVPRATYDNLWDQIVRISARTFVEGYASAKKCSIEGRALMQLDFQQYLKNVEKLVEIKPIPDREYVENYIKAYYFPENQLEGWLPEHREYSLKQLVSLVNVVDHLNRKAKQRLTAMLEDIEKSRR
ncbi:syndetin-like isoform X2 [Dreissena polymorpha]|uniref:syndetin-like isoform X2 n=1 Tax=Dreissena polymorpha TaxID=45954 RepID=UPI002264CEF8|nr:syndetin-like isoform X2 [Dreissena polymorpha]